MVVGALLIALYDRADGYVASPLDQTGEHR